MISVKTYICPVCLSTEEVSTNHSSEIYSECRSCKNIGLYCKETYDNMTWDSEMFVLVYSYDISNPEESNQYDELTETLRRFNYNPFKTHPAPFGGFGKMWKRLTEMEVVKISKPETFDNQYITNAGRLHQWYEPVFPNEKIRKGYYLIPKNDV